MRLYEVRNAGVSDIEKNILEISHYDLGKLGLQKIEMLPKTLKKDGKIRFIE